MVSPTSGEVYERHIIEKLIRENGVDPSNQQPLSAEDLIELKQYSGFSTEAADKANQTKISGKIQPKEENLFEDPELGLAPDGPKGAICLKCTKTFSSMSCAKRHFMAFHGNQAKKSWACPKCGKKFGQKRYRQEHMKKAYGIKASHLKNQTKPKFKKENEQ